MKRYIRKRANAGYRWIEANPATAILVSSGTAALLAIALTAALGIYSHETYVAKSVCSRNPTGRECAAIQQAISRAEPIENPCISHQRVEGTRGRNCPRFYIPRTKKGGGAQQTPHHQAHQQPGPQSGGGSEEAGRAPVPSQPETPAQPVPEPKEQPDLEGAVDGVTDTATEAVCGVVEAPLVCTSPPSGG